MTDMTHEKCSEVLDAFNAKAKYSEELAAFSADEYASSDSLEAKRNYIAHKRDAGVWREAVKLFSAVRVSK